MIRLALIATAGLTLVAAPAVAQTWAGTYDGGYRGGDTSRPYYDSGSGQRSHGDGHGYRRSNAVPSNFDWRSQLDRPGDYRCDQFWDASRDDCGARWRDQRRQASPQARRDYRDLAGYGRGGSGYGHAPYGYSPRRGYGSAYDYGHAQGSTTYHGAYGRPDHVYPGSGGSSRADWCRATYRSYDPASGYYRAYSGRLVYCG
jgi:hypothetical protein